jgi:hypothetical protein
MTTSAVSLSQFYWGIGATHQKVRRFATETSLEANPNSTVHSCRSEILSLCGNLFLHG